MPRFDFNPADATAGIPVYPKGSYEMTLGEPKTFYRQGKNGKSDNYGIMFRAKINEGHFAGKPFIINCYLHNEDSLGFTKQVQMAAFGFNPKKPGDEEAFDRKASELDWSFNTDDNSCGSGWQQMKGQVVVYDLDQGINQETGDAQQKTVAVRPL